MWLRFQRWFHHLFNPHCLECQAREDEKKVCASCEILQRQLAYMNRSNEMILRTALAVPEPEERVETENLQPIRTFVPFRVRREALEQLDRARAKEAKEKKEHAAADAT